MPLKEQPLATFFGDDTFPIEWASDTERDLFWVFDDLHCPHPLSPMYEDIGGWWLSCDHMFRRFGTPFATDWLAKNVNGYLYTAAIPAEPGLRAGAQEHGFEMTGIVPRDPRYPETIGPYLDTVLPVYGLEFADTWRDRLVPEMDRNFAFLEGMLDRKADLTLAQLAVLLEDAIDIHDRHWKIHWMLNFAQLSATLKLRAVMEQTHGRVDETLLGRLQNSASDRNWDKIRSIWEMKEEAKADPELSRLFAGPAADLPGALRASERGRRFIAERIEPYQLEFGWHAVWSHEFVFPTFREQLEPVVELVRNQFESDYDYPTKIAELAADIDAAAAEILEGLDGRGARRDARRARDQPADGAAHPRSPLLHRPGRERAPPAGAHRDRGEARGAGRARCRRRRRVPALQRAAGADRRPAGLPGTRARGGGPRGARTGLHVPAARLGRDRHGDPARVPVSRELGLPRQVPPRPGRGRRRHHRRRRVAGRGRGRRPRRPLRGRLRRGPDRRRARVPDDQPGLAGAVQPDHGAGHGCGRRSTGAPRGPRARVRDPGRRRHVGRDAADQHRRPDPGRRQCRRGRRSSRAADAAASAARLD